MKKAFYCLILSTIMLCLLIPNFIFATDALFVDDEGNVGIGLAEPKDKLDVIGQTRSHSNVIYHYNAVAPSDLWGGPYLINQTGFIGHMGNYALDIAWNGYRRTPDNKYNVLGINGSDTINAIRLCDEGIRFDTQDGMSDGDDPPISRMIIKKNGNVGIGTTNPVQRLHIENGSIAFRYPSNPANERLLFFSTTGTGVDSTGYKFTWRNDDLSLRKNQIELDRNGNVYFRGGSIGIGTVSPSYTLDVVGSIHATETIWSDTWSSSDIRLKENIEEIENALEMVSGLRGVRFQWKDEQKDQGAKIGVIAQEVEKIFPEIVHEDAEGYKAVDYAKLIAPIIEAVKELKKEKDTEIAELKAENGQLKERLTQIEARLSSVELLKTKK